MLQLNNFYFDFADLDFTLTKNQQRNDCHLPAPHSEGAGVEQSSAQHWHYEALQICLHMGKLLREQALHPLAWLVCLGFASELNLCQGEALTVTAQLPMSFGKHY